MKIETMMCRLDGTQELCEEEVPDDWFSAQAADASAQSGGTAAEAASASAGSDGARA